jgi:hypothetical protein
VKISIGNCNERGELIAAWVKQFGEGARRRVVDELIPEVEAELARRLQSSKEESK